MIWFLYNVVFAIGFTAMLPWFLYRMVRRGGYAKHFLSRLGSYEPELLARLAGGGFVWVHAVSVGEFHVARLFMNGLRARRPEVKFFLTVTTSTGYRLAASQITGSDVLAYFPADFPVVVRRVLKLVRPSALILVEKEMWPNLIRMAHARGLPVCLINGMVSERSHRRYRMIRPLTRRLLACIDTFCVQGEIDRDRLLDIGADPGRVHIVGTAKYDVAPSGQDGAEKARAVLAAAGAPGDAQILLGGSTWAGEEEALLDVYGKLRSRFPKLLLVLVPRHAERRADVIREVEARGLVGVLKTEMDKKAPAVPRLDVLIVDTTGELMSFYACADVVFVGKSLTQHGGQNVIEPAVYAKPIIVGPHLENFTVVSEDFTAAKAFVQVADTKGLEDAAARFLDDPELRAGYGRRAAQLVKDKAGAVLESLKLLPL